MGAKKLNTVLRPQGIEGVHLTGASHSPDLWYPYLWMLGGDILKMKSGHPTRGSYWFPAFNSTEVIKKSLPMEIYASADFIVLEDRYCNLFCVAQVKGHRNHKHLL